MTVRRKMPDRRQRDDGNPHPRVDPLGWPIGNDRGTDIERESGLNDLGWPDRGSGLGSVVGPDGATYSGSDLF